MIRRRYQGWLAVAALAFAALRPAYAEVSDVSLSLQFGIGYLPLTVMRRDKLVEKHLAAEGLGATKVTWARLGAGSAANDALLSGSLNFAAGGTAPAFLLWDRTMGNLGVRGVAALCSMPNLLVTRNPNVKTLRDFTDKDRIAMAGAGSSVQTYYLRMAAAQLFGMKHYNKFDSLMVKMPHPVGLTALLSGQGEIDAQFTSPPFQYYALEHPGIHTVLNSYDVMGGPNTFLMVWATEKFRKENPKTYKAVFDALSEATAFINAHPKEAAQIYVADGGNKDSVDKILGMMEKPGMKYTLAPQATLKYAKFMYQVGVLHHDPKSWKDLFFSEVHDLPGS